MSVGRYSDDRLAYDVHAKGTYWELAVGLNFTKFLRRDPNLKLETQRSETNQNTKASFGWKGLSSEPSSLKVIYRMSGTRDDVSNGETAQINHLFGVVYRTMF